MLGKYLNGYEPTKNGPEPGWDEWDVAGNGYPEFNYDLNDDGKVVHYGKTSTDYLTDVLSGIAGGFIKKVGGGAILHRGWRPLCPARALYPGATRRRASFPSGGGAAMHRCLRGAAGHQRAALAQGHPAADQADRSQDRPGFPHAGCRRCRRSTR